MAQVYDNAEVFQRVFSQLFDEINAAGADQLDALVAEAMVVRFRVREPEAEWWVDGRTKPVTTSFEPLSTNATLTADLTGDNLHELLLGTLPLGKALFWGKLKVHGSRSKALRLESLLHACQAAYPDVIATATGDS